MTQWTKGPWVVDSSPSTNDADRSITARTASGNPRYVARVYGEGVLAKPSQERIANARLIVAAPEMAELLERIAANPHTEEWTRQRSEARALLARIKGE